MKILRINSLGYEAGGSDNGIILVNEELRKRGHEVRTLASDLGPSVGRYNEYSFPAFERLPMYKKLLYRAFYPAPYHALKRILKEWQPDIIQLHTMPEVSPSVLFAMRDIPAVLTIHGAEDFTPSLLVWAFPRRFFWREGFSLTSLTLLGWLHYIYHRYVSGFVYQLGFRNVDELIVFSDYMQRLMKVDGLTTTVVPNATKLFQPAPIDTASKTIAYVGRLEEIKGVQFIIEALPQILKKFPNARLKIAGTGAYEPDLKRMVAERHLGESVEFLGHLTRDGLHALYKECALSVVPSIWPEPFGKVGIEAMSVGRPVIAADVGGISEWLTHGETGYLVVPGNSSEIAVRVMELFENESLLSQMAQSAQRDAWRFSIEEHTDRILTLYERVIGSRRGGSA